MGVGVDVHGVARRKPTRVMPVCSASSTARLEGALTAAIRGTPATAAFWTTSNEHAPGHEQHPPGQRQAPLGGRPPDHLVDRVVASNVLANAEHAALGVADGGRVEPAGLLEDPLGLPYPLRDRGQDPGGHGQAVPATVGQAAVTASIEALPQTPQDEEVTASRSSDGSGTGTPGRRSTVSTLNSCACPSGAQKRTASTSSGSGDQPLADAVADGQLDVVARRPHGHPDRTPGHPQLQRLLDGQPVPSPPGLAARPRPSAPGARQPPAPPSPPPRLSRSLHSQGYVPPRPRAPGPPRSQHLPRGGIRRGGC